MKALKQNNPIVIGILFCILIGAIVKIASLLHEDEAPPIVTLAARSVDVAGKTPPPLAAPQQVSARDPFYHPALRRLQAVQAGMAPDEALPQDIASDPAPTPLQPLDITQLTAPDSKSARPVPAGPSLIRPMLPPHKDVPPPPATDREADLVAHLKLTAIVEGARQTAVIEGGGPQPLEGHVGDMVGPLRVAAINSQEIVLAGARGIWTLPLETPGEVNAASMTTHEENIDAPH